MARKLPIGIQSFEKLRQEGFVYVDKTAHVHALAHSGVPCFLSRPRRFGKSLLVSILRAYFEGRRELFEALDIEQLEENVPEGSRGRLLYAQSIETLPCREAESPFYHRDLGYHR